MNIVEDLGKDTWVKAVTAKIECQTVVHEAASKTSNLLLSLNHEHGSGIRLETEETDGQIKTCGTGA